MLLLNIRKDVRTGRQSDAAFERSEVLEMAVDTFRMVTTVTSIAPAHRGGYRLPGIEKAQCPDARSAHRLPGWIRLHRFGDQRDRRDCCQAAA